MNRLLLTMFSKRRGKSGPSAIPKRGAMDMRQVSGATQTTEADSGEQLATGRSGRENSGKLNQTTPCFVQ